MNERSNGQQSFEQSIFAHAKRGIVVFKWEIAEHLCVSLHANPITLVA